MRKSSLRPFWLVVLLFVAATPWPSGIASAADCGIASAHPLATRAGCDTMQAGGNAFDAAVAVASTLAVVEPFASGIGGGGFLLLHRAADGYETFVDARETAPGKASPAFYLDSDGKPKERLSLDGAAAAGIPGTPAALDWVAMNYGRLPLAKSLEAAVRLAEEGFPADARYVAASLQREAMLRTNPRAARAFLDEGRAVAANFLVRQPDLARTLRQLAREGRKGFYEGEVAREMVVAVQAAGGLWDLADLKGYAVVERQPLRLTYRNAKITTAPLPSSGGLVLAQALYMLEPLPLGSMSPPDRAHHVVEALRRGYQDRARYMGDPAFVKVPPHLASREYALQRGESIRPDHATSSADLAALPAAEGEDTTHFSIVDAEGNRVAATLSVNGAFGSAFVAGSTGVLLNNHMDDFTLAPGAANLYGLQGAEANAVAPGKRPLSSMSPTFVEDERGVLVLGTPGGSRIISMVLLGILDYMYHPVPDLARLVAAPRYHHQFLPDRIQFEPEGFDDAWIADLKAKGHVVEAGRRRWGNMQVVFVDRKTRRVVPENDPRGKAGVLF
jgi:gamma-glutamyltranspeptidase / glutathione hydrolase